jgi:hypothetical protein
MRLLQKKRRSLQRAGEREPPPSSKVRRCRRTRRLLHPLLQLGCAKGALSLRNGRERRQQQRGRRL